MSDGAPALLVVDDNEDNRYTLALRLKRQGYEDVATAEHGRKALELLDAHAFDLVLLDIMMPEMNGYEVLETMKGSPKLRDIPVVMISALDEGDSIVRCIEIGAEDYLPKPFNPTLLRARVRACLEKKRLRNREAAYLEQLESEQKRFDDLLYALLPAGAAQELKATGAIRPRQVEDVAVLVCGIVGFAEYRDQRPPEQVVSELQSLLESLEVIALMHGLENIRTTDGVFFATAGLHDRGAEPVLSAARCGLEMVAAAAKAVPCWRIRVGIHFGPVVAGAIGGRRLFYDLWGIR